MQSAKFYTIELFNVSIVLFVTFVIILLLSFSGERKNMKSKKILKLSKFFLLLAIICSTLWIVYTRHISYFYRKIYDCPRANAKTINDISSKHNCISNAKKLFKNTTYLSKLKKGNSDFYYFNTNKKKQQGTFIICTKKGTLKPQLYNVYGEKVSFKQSNKKNTITLSYQSIISQRCYLKISNTHSKSNSLSYTLSWNNGLFKLKKPSTQISKKSSIQKKPQKNSKSTLSHSKKIIERKKSPDSQKKVSIKPKQQKSKKKKSTKKKTQKKQYYISFSKHFIRIKQGKHMHIKTKNNLSKKDTILWKSCNPSIASVSHGNIIANHDGITVIYAYSKKHTKVKAQCTISVY